MNIHSSLSSSTSRESRILCINFNQDQGCFAVGHENGFLVYNSNPIDLRVKRNFAHHHSNGSSGSGIGHITMLHRTNYLALVGGGKNPKFANNKLIIWDDLKRKNSLSLEFMSPVLNVLLSRVRIIVVLRNQVLVYGFSAPPKKIATYETIDNEYGLADLSVNSSTSSLMVVGASSGSSLSDINLSSTSSTASITSSSSGRDGAKYQTLAFPGRSVGQIQLVDVSPHGQEKNLVSIIKAHKLKIRCLALNRTGTLIASASETGTIIRVHSTHNTALLYEFRRGLDRAIITSMKFSHNDLKLAVLSDKNTLHIFNIGSDTTSTNTSSLSSSPPSTSAFKLGSTPEPHVHSGTPMNRHHLLKNLPLPLPIPNYFKSTWSFCSVNTNQYHQDMPGDSGNDIGVLGWSGNDSVIIIWRNKRIWERYVIIEKLHPSTANTAIDDFGKSSSGNTSSWEIVRYSWKNLDSVAD